MAEPEWLTPVEHDAWMALAEVLFVLPAGLESQESVMTIKPDKPSVAVDTSSLAPPDSLFGIIVESHGGGRENIS